MGDPIWLDNNAVSFAMKGDVAIQNDLATFRKAGRKLLIVPSVYSEILDGNVVTGGKAPTPQSRVQMEIAMKRMGIELDLSARSTTVKNRMQVSPNVSISDGQILSQVKASGDARGIAMPELFTAEGAQKGIVTHAPQFGVRVIRPTQAPMSVPKPPKVDLADYPPDREGTLSRFFKDRPVLKKLGVIGGSVLATQLAGEALNGVQAHFEQAINKARGEFEKTHPDPASLWRVAGIDRHRSAYQQALAKLKAPSNAKIAAAVMLAFTPN